MSEFKMPTEAEKAATVNVLKNISALLKKGLFFGEYAGHIFEAVKWLDNCAEKMEPMPEPDPKLSLVQE